MTDKEILELYEQLETLLKLLQVKREHYQRFYNEADSEEEKTEYYWHIRECEEEAKKAYSLMGVIELHSEYPDFENIFNSTTQKAEGILKDKRKKEYDKIMADMEARKAK
ncbi:hypothetical protein [Bacillus gobiensis]|uniref:hypothetical protein n=1 Tax=Bacillus gobiensis TaxID=1441095 RepID=UPI003D21944C